MYVYQNGKLYLENGDNLVGVEINSDGVSTKIEEITEKLNETGMFLTRSEVNSKFQLHDGGSYTFPCPKPEVIEIELVRQEPIVKMEKPKVKGKK